VYIYANENEGICIWVVCGMGHGHDGGVATVGLTYDLDLRL